MIGGILLAGRLNHLRETQLFQDRLEGLRAVGEPFTLEEMAKAYPDPAADRDFGRFWARQGFGNPGGGYPVVRALDPMRSTRHRVPFGSDLMQMCEEDARTNAPILEMAMRTDFRGFGCANDWSEGFPSSRSGTAGEQPFTQEKVHSFRFYVCAALAQQAMYHAELGQDERATAHLIKGLEVAGIPSVSGLRSARGGMLAQAWMLLAVERTMNRTPLSEEQLGRLHERLRTGPAEALTELLIQERANLFWKFSESRSITEASPTPSLLDRLIRAAEGIRGTDQRVEFMDRWRAFIDASRLPSARGDAEFERITDGYLAWHPCQQRRGMLDFVLATLENKNALFVRTFERDVRDIASLHGQVVAKWECARMAVAVARWRLAHGGALPDSLEALVPEFLDYVPVDPADYSPIKYRVRGQGYVVYSVGQDGMDDGGPEMPWNQLRPDVVFGVEGAGQTGKETAMAAVGSGTGR